MAHLSSTFFSYNPPSSATASGYTSAFSAPYASGRIPPPEFEQRVPSAVTSISHALHPSSLQPSSHLHTHRHGYHEYTGFSAVPSSAAGGLPLTYPKHKSYLSSTMISIPKSGYYVGAVQETSLPYKQRHSFDSNMLPPSASGGVGYLPTAAAAAAASKLQDNKSLQKMNCFPKQRFTPYTGRLMTTQSMVPVPPSTFSAATMTGDLTAMHRQQQQQPHNSLQRVPTIPPLNTSGSHFSHNSSHGMNVSASSFNNSKSDLDSTANDHADSYPGTKMETGDSSGSSSMANVSSSSSTRNDSGIGIGMGTAADLQKKVMLQLNNLDSSYDESALKKFLVSLLKPITPIVSLIIDGPSSAKIEVPSPHFAKSVISQLHRKKIGRKRMLVSYCKETINDISTLGYQVAGLLKDVPFYTLPLNKFRELFQARFKASISVLELYKMVDVCHIRTDENEEKHIHLNQAFLAKIEDSPFNPNLQHSIPYCARHFKRENYKGWAEQELEPLPHVFLTISQVQSIIYRLMQTHTDGIPVASILHCIEACLNVSVTANENGISLEHLLSCTKGVQIGNNVYGIKIIGLTTGHEARPSSAAITAPDIYDAGDALFYSSNNYTLTPAQSLAKEVIELLKICPRATMNFSKFVPAYHNYFGKQCRVADYGYTKLIELFEGMSSIIQVLGEGNNRHITLTHRIQVRRFTNDLMKTIKWQVNKSALLSKLPHLLAFTLNHTFSITDYGVCSLNDMLEEMEGNGVITIERLALATGNDILISLPKHKQSRHEIEKTFHFTGEIVELLRNLPHYEILFQKFVKSYFYHFGYHCRLSDYGFQKLAELFETVEGLIVLDPSNDENRKLNLAPIVARRIFAEQLNEIVSLYSRRKGIQVPLVDVLNLFRNKFGYSMIPQTLGCTTIDEMMRCLPFIEINESEKDFFVICHGADEEFRKKSLMVCLLFIHLQTDSILYSEFFPLFYQKFNEYLTEPYILAMKHVIEIRIQNGLQIVILSELFKFILWIVCRLDAKTPTSIKSLKNHLNIQINTCFSLGFANLSTLLAAFPEIFHVHGRLHENSEILLQQTFFITKAEIQKYFQSLKKQADQLVPGKTPQAPPMNYYMPTNMPQALPPAYLPSATPTPVSDQTLDYNAAAFVPQFNSQIDPMASFYAQQSSSKAMIATSRAGSLAAAAAPTTAQLTSLIPKSYADLQSAIVPPGLEQSSNIISKWIKGVKRDFIPLNIRAALYEPPKPDTPPGKLWPFGYDPIWSDDILSPPMDMAHLKLPPISPVQFPVLRTPAHLKVSNMTLFDFDAAYKDMMTGLGPAAH